MAGFPILGPEPVESLEGGVDAMYAVVHEARDFAAKILEETDAWRLVEAPTEGGVLGMPVSVPAAAGARLAN